MLEFIRRQSTSFVSWLILGAIALVFGLQFGLPSDSLTMGPGSIAEVHDHEIRQEDFRYQQVLASMFGLTFKEPQMQELVGQNEELIDGMVERILLAEEARRMGLDATQTEAEDLLLDGHVILFGQRMEWLSPDRKYAPNLLQATLLRPLGIKDLKLLEYQADELAAQALRDVMAASVVIPESEVRRAYEEGANQLSLRYARYEFAAFADLVEPTTEQLDAYVGEHTEDLEKQYESQKTRFTELPPQAQLSLVQVGAGDEARAELEAAREAVAGGTKTFGDVARERSTHDTATRGGDYGWIDEKSESASDLPDAVREAIPGLTEGEPSPVIEADGSLWLLRVEARREGDVPKEEALRELAGEGLRDQLAEELARRAAEEDQNAVAAGNPVEEVFSSPGALGETTLFGGTSIEDVPLPGEDDEGSEGAEGDAPAAPSADPAAGRSRPKAELRSTGPFRRGERIPGLGMVPELLDDAWTFADDAELLEGIYEVPGAVVLAGVESKLEANDTEYAEQRDELYANLRRVKAAKIAQAFTRNRCLESKAQGDIKVSEETVKRLTTYDTSEETGEDGKPVKPPRQPFAVCDRVGRGGLLRGR